MVGRAPTMRFLFKFFDLFIEGGYLGEVALLLSCIEFLELPDFHAVVLQFVILGDTASRPKLKVMAHPMIY